MRASHVRRTKHQINHDMTMTTEEEMAARVQAEMQVEAFISLIERRYGIKPENIPHMVADLEWIHNHRGHISKISWAIALGILSLAASGIALAFWTGLKHLVNGGKA